MRQGGEVIIIGGGIGGLFAGAFLSRNGLKVTVLEKNGIIGGGLQCFTRKGKHYETGMHVMGGLEKGGALYRLCRYLGIYDQLNIHHIDSDCMDEIRYERTGELFRIPSGRDAFVARMSEYFPNEKDGIKNYVDALYELTDELPLFNLKEESAGFAEHSERYSWSADRFISHFVSDPKLRELLAYLNPLYSGVEGHTPAYVHALLNVLYLNGASRFVGGSQQLADALKGVITGGGGEVLAAHEVIGIDVEDGEVKGVRTRHGNCFTGDCYISAVHPVELLRLATPGAFRRTFEKRLREIPSSYSAFSLYIDLKPGMFPYIDHTCYYAENFGNIWNHHSVAPEKWPAGFMYMTPPENEQGEFAERLLVHCVMDYAWVRRWENSSVGSRGPEYEVWKRGCENRIIDKLERLYPGFRGMVNEVYSSSPLTIRDYYHTRDGAMFGYVHDCENLIFSQLSVRTKIRNLFLTGQNVNLHGICGVPLTAVSTVEAILGANTIINEAAKLD